jgi:hypothetical protein
MADVLTIHSLETAAWQYQQAHGRLSDAAEALMIDQLLSVGPELDVDRWMGMTNEKMTSVGNLSLELVIGFLILQFDLLGTPERLDVPGNDWFRDDIGNWSPAVIVDAQNHQQQNPGTPIGETLAGLTGKLKREVTAFVNRTEFRAFSDGVRQVGRSLNAMKIPQGSACGFCIQGAAHPWHVSLSGSGSSMKSHNFCRCGWRLMASDEKFTPRMEAPIDKRATPEGDTPQ